MTRLDPSLFINRLVISSKGVAAYDQEFHRGVNIISSKVNAVGKSTVSNFLFYVLGGEEVGWTEAALECDHVWAEVEINGTPLTLRRLVSEQKERPLNIFWGTYEECAKAPLTAWESYPFAKRGESISFTQVLFNALEIPEVKHELSSNITMHQVLRLIFADQESPHYELFRHQNWIAKDTLAAVGGLMCGYFDDQIYILRQKKEELHGARQRVTAQLRSLWSVLGSDEDQVGGLKILEAQLEEAESQLARTVTSPIEDEPTKETDNPDEQAKLSLEIGALRKRILENEQTLNALEYEIADSALFVESLSSNREALDLSNNTRKALGTIAFDSCPACLATLNEAKPGHCQLCRSPYDVKEERARFLRLRQQLQQQIEESQRLQTERIATRNKIARALPGFRSELIAKQQELTQFSDSLVSIREERIAQKYQRVGYLNRKIEDLKQQIELAHKIADLESLSKSLAIQISSVETELLRRETKMEEMTQVAHTSIEELMIVILQRDIDVQKEFIEATKVGFSFRDNSVWVGNRNKVSESSLVYLRNAFHLAILVASTENPYFRYPRIAVFDDLEEGGTTPDRSQNLQRLIVEMSAACQNEHQIIFTTSMIDDSLLDSGLAIGEPHTSDNPTLNLPSGLKPHSSSSKGSPRVSDSINPAGGRGLL